LVVPGLIETHLHLDKTCILDRCRAEEGTLAEAVRETAAAKRSFTAEDVYARGRRTLERCIAHGTMHVRTHVELDPGIGMTGFEGVRQLARDYAWAVDMEFCVFPQEGLLNNPGTKALLTQALRQGARVLGAAPYTDSDPRGQIDRIFALAREFDVDIDMQIEYVCRKTEEHGWGGRVAVGHATQLSLVPRARYDAIAAQLARAGVAVTILPATDLYLMGRSHAHAVPRGVVPAELLRRAGVTCSLATNNMLNPFTPYGDGSLIRIANLYANVCHVARPAELAGCLDMITGSAARLLRLPGYGIAAGGAADLVAIDAANPADAIATVAQPLWGLKDGRRTFTRPRALLHAAAGAPSPAVAAFTCLQMRKPAGFFGALCARFHSDEHKSMDSHTLLWLTTLIMAGGGLLILITGKRRTPSEELHTVLHGIVPLIAACSYFAMATGQGAVILGADAAAAGTGAGRIFYFARYIDWTFTTPLLLVTLCMTAMHSGEKRAGAIAGAVLADIMMILTAFFFGASELDFGHFRLGSMRLR
jgi:cytosine deaminase